MKILDVLDSAGELIIGSLIIPLPLIVQYWVTQVIKYVAMNVDEETKFLIYSAHIIFLMVSMYPYPLALMYLYKCVIRRIFLKHSINVDEILRNFTDSIIF